MGASSAQRTGDILESLGWQPERLQISGVDWAWSARPTRDVLVRVVRPEGSPLVHVELNARFLGEDARQLAEGGALSNSVKLQLLAANLEYDFHDDGAARVATVIDYLPDDDVTLANLGRCVRRVKDAYYATLVLLQAASTAPRHGPATEATLTTVAVAPETWTLLQQALVPGQTVDELIRELLRRDATP